MTVAIEKYQCSKNKKQVNCSSWLGHTVHLGLKTNKRACKYFKLNHSNTHSSSELCKASHTVCTISRFSSTVQRDTKKIP